MKEFLKDYVEMIAESREVTLTEAQVSQIVNSLQDDESLWDMFDCYVDDEITRVKSYDIDI